jgi:hypothetical protein
MKTVKMDKLFTYYILDIFCKKYNITKDDAINNPANNFRLLCFNMNYYMKSIILPKFKKTSLYETVFIEFRDFLHVEFLIRNTIVQMGPKWSHTIICGNINYNLIVNICNSISPNINIIKIDVDNMTQSEYSKFLTTIEFWNLLKGEKILIYQEDSIIFKNNIQEFIEYDFIGAPFLKTTNDTPNSVGNGGLSLRSKSKMIEVINKFSPKDYHYNSSTYEYMNYVNLEFPPEDVYFSKCMQEQSIGIVANWDAAHEFSSETVFNNDSFGAHKFWISNDKWNYYMKNKFNFKIYKPKSNLNKLLLFNSQPLSFNLNAQKENAFDIDLYFFCKANNVEYINTINALHYFKNIALDGFVYHPKQLLNIYPDILFHSFLNDIYVVNKFKPTKNLIRPAGSHSSWSMTDKEINPSPEGTDLNLQRFNITPLYQFVNKNLYNSSFTIFSDLLIKKKYSCLNNNYDILLLVFIGNEDIGFDLIERILKYKEIQNNFNVAFCFNENVIKDYNIFKETIRNYFDFYAIYKCKELGSDIIPTLLMYDDVTKTHNFTHIIKFHTKYIDDHYQNLTNFLVSTPLNDLINQNERLLLMSNCIGNPTYYINLQMDYFNDILKKKHSSKIDFNKQFIAGTIFYTSSIVFDAVLDFVKNNNYRSFLLNNLYENNAINQNFSPIHFLERLFGIIIVNNVN